MTQFLRKKFSVALGSKAYSANWDAVFGKKAASPPADGEQADRTSAEPDDPAPPAPVRGE